MRFQTTFMISQTGSLIPSLLAHASPISAPLSATGSQVRASTPSASDIVTTDTLLFDITLAAFIQRRSVEDPPTLDWTSDGCTRSPDNPFHFPFLPACNRHDFGYANYRLQHRFTVSAKYRIDEHFKTDLDGQCNLSRVRHKEICRVLAALYHLGVQIGGGRDATPGRRWWDGERNRTEPRILQQEYGARLAQYERMIAEARRKGELPGNATACSGVVSK